MARLGILMKMALGMVLMELPNLQILVLKNRQVGMLMA